MLLWSKDFYPSPYDFKDPKTLTFSTSTFYYRDCTQRNLNRPFNGCMPTLISRHAIAEYLDAKSNQKRQKGNTIYTRN